MSACDKHASVPAIGISACPGCEIDSLIEEINDLHAKINFLEQAKLWWVAPAGSGLIRCVRDSRYRMFGPSVRKHYSPVLIQDDDQMRKDAERYRWLRDKADSANWESIGNLSPEDGEAEIDAAMAKEAK